MLTRFWYCKQVLEQKITIYRGELKWERNQKILRQ